MTKDLRLRRVSSFESVTVKDAGRRAEMLKDLVGCFKNPLFTTCLRGDFELGEFETAMEFEAVTGRKAVFRLSK